MTFAQPDVDTVDDGLRAYVWGATATGIGRHPERITDLELRRRTVAIVTELDTVALDSPTRDVPDWVAREVDDVVARHPEIGADGADALRSLLAWMVR